MHRVRRACRDRRHGWRNRRAQDGRALTPRLDNRPPCRGGRTDPLAHPVCCGSVGNVKAPSQHGVAGRRSLAAAILAALGSITFATAAPAVADAPDEVVRIYLEQIKPVLRERCYACHGALQQRSGLRLDTAERLLAGASGRAVIAPGEPAAGSLLERLTTDDVEQRMPLDAHPLTDEQIAAIRQWIAAGAPVPEDEAGEDDPLDHWAFQPIERPVVPGAGGPEAHPVDAFLATAHQRHGLVPQPGAERHVLLRRLYLGLTGLPPDADQLADARPFEEIVDELLHSPRHGERWARHWMDVWRYADWYGLDDQLRNSQKHLWHWRDWIVESLVADKGYDRMVREMLAADELAPGDADAVRATGFLARNYYLFNRTTWLDDTIEHTGKAFLGLTLNCAKCHDHKSDPVSMVDYYNFRALLEPHHVRLDPVPGELDFERDGIPRAFDFRPAASTVLHRRGDPADPDDEVEIVPAVPAAFAWFAPPIEAVELPADEWAPAMRESRRRDVLGAAIAALEEARVERDAAAAAVDNPRPGAVDPAVAEPAWLMDDFENAAPERWEMIGDHWRYDDGRLRLTTATRDPAMLRSREPHPRDFDLRVRYTTTGGDTYKSVTVRFDLDDDGRQANMVYTSAHEQAPKVQVAVTRDGHTSYPGEGAAPRPILVGEPHELRVAVRDHLVNVWLDDELVVAYELPSRPAGGGLALSGFDATVDFESIEVRPLAAAIVLAEPQENGRPDLAEPQRRLEVAAAGLELAEAELARLEAVVAADLAALNGGDDGLAAVAARRQAEAGVARARMRLVELGDAAADDEVGAAREALAAEEARLQGDIPGHAPLRGALVALETPEHNQDTYAATFPQTSTGRRLMLARWITSEQNPLTARVAVNHIWLRHFGEPLVETVFDFGRLAPEPDHMELLDWLAAEFMESGWSMRHLHRLLVTSEAWRRSSSNLDADPATLAADPDNRFYWRAHPRRMESQVVRDSVLQLAGQLDPASGGPPAPVDGGSLRRSLYLTHSRDDEDRFLSMFDNADILQCYRRSESIVPQQALALANAAISIDMAAHVARRLEEGNDASGRRDFVRAAFGLVLGRAPDQEETDACLDYWNAMEQLESVRAAPDPGALVRARLVHALFNHNDFLTIR